MDLSTSIGLGRGQGRISSAAPAAPAALGLLPDLAVQRDTAMTPLHVSADFTGPQITYALAPGSDALPAGLTLSVTGILSGTPTEEVARNLIVRGTNAQGSADSGFSVTVLAVLLDFTATLSGATANPTHGASAQTGVPLTAGATGFSGSPPGSVTYQWATVESGEIPGATGATYTPDAALYDGETVFCTVTPAGYPPKTTSALKVRQVPPVAAGALWDEILDLGSGVELYDVAGDFTGLGLVYSVTGPGCAIDAATGRLSIDPASSVAGATVTVTALNSGGAALSAFTLTVEDAGIGAGPDLGQPALDEATDTISLTVDVDCTIYWRRDATATNPTADMVIAGGGLDAGSFAVTSGANEIDIAFATGNDGVQEISFVAAVTPAEPSLVQTVAIDIDTTDPVLVSSAPAAGAGGVSPLVIPVLTFSEPVSPGLGTVSLYDVTGAGTVEAFDVVTNAGTGAGQVEIAGPTLTIRPSATLVSGRTYAVLVDAGAVTDLAGNPFAGIASTATLAFVTGAAPVVDTEFGATFQTDEATLWAAIQANPYNATPEHRGTETWGAYPASVTDGGIVGVKAGNYPQLRFPVPVEVGKTYTIDADFPVGENTWAGPLRVKIGSARDLADYAQIDETQAGQPRVVELRGQQVTATTAELWFAVIVETGSGLELGGNPAISRLSVREV
jgi:hypothetical protein